MVKRPEDAAVLVLGEHEVIHHENKSAVECGYPLDNLVIMDYQTNLTRPLTEGERKGLYLFADKLKTFTTTQKQVSYSKV